MQNEQKNGMTDWRCNKCEKMLGKQQGNQLHIKIGDKHRYVVTGTVVSICPGCGASNSTQTAV